MARQQFQTAPYVKHLEVYNDFSGGLNTTTTNDRLKDNELTDISNMDLGDRGSLKRRAGMSLHIQIPNEITWKDLGPKKWSDLK